MKTGTGKNGERFFAVSDKSGLFEKIESCAALERSDLESILQLSEAEDLQRLYRAAYRVKERFAGRKVYFRGLIEISNICSKNCYYCGIRRDNRKVQRYRMTDEEILHAACWAESHEFGSVVLQSGERSDPAFTDWIVSLLRRIHAATGGDENGKRGRLGVTLALGEQPEETYRKWFEAGAQRYLLRIEASDPELYAKLHPADHSYGKRLDCLRTLQKIGYQTGTGVMIGLPHQTVRNLADDLLFFRDNDIDMIGMGPYLIHEDTPLAREFPDFQFKKAHQLEMGLKMIAAARLLLKDVNIASTTALQALRPDGRELGLLAGANVIMPNITDARYRESYRLYEGKPGVQDGPEDSLGPLRESVEKLGETIAFGEHGDPEHYFKRTGNIRSHL